MQDHIDRIEIRLTTMEAQLDEILAIFRAGKAGGAILKWTVGVGLAVIGIWATWKGLK